MEGIVKKIRKNRNGYFIEIITKEKTMKLFSRDYVEEGSYIEFDHNEREIFNIREKEGKEAFIKNLLSSIKGRSIDIEIKDEVLGRMKEDMEEFTKKVEEINLLGREAIVRFNNDADGISSALLLKEVLNGYYIQHNAPIYYKRDAFNDLNALMNRFKPVLIMLDFGGNEESIEALEIISSSGIEVIIIDHHPYSREVENYATLINPHKYGDESRITTGLICYLIAKAFGKGEEELLKISLAGDKSDIIDISEEDKEKALIIDYVANYVNYGGKLDLYKEVLKNKELRETLRIQALEKMEEAKEVVMKSYKKTEVGGVSIYEINLESIDKSEFPSRSKMTTQLYELFKDENAVFLGLTNRAIIFRISEKAYNNGIDARRIIEKIKEKYNERIESGGGHGKAASLRVKEEGMLEFIKGEVKDIIKEMANKNE